MKKYLASVKKYFSFLVLVLLVLYFKKNINLFSPLLNIRVYNIVILLAALIVTLIFNSLMLSIVLGYFNIKISFADAFKFRIISKYYNYIIAKGGTIYKSHYLKNKHHISFKKIFFVLGYISFIQIFSSISISLFILLYKKINNELFNLKLLYTFILLFTVFVISFVFTDLFKKLILKKDKFKKIIPVFKYLKLNKKFFIIFSLSLIAILISSTKLYYSFKIISEPVNIADAILLTSASRIGFLFNFTPGAIGLREGIVSLIALHINIDFDKSMAALLIDRAVTSSFFLLVGFILTQFKKNEQQN